MTKKINIKAGTVMITAELNQTSTADAIWKALPLESSVNLWGEEIYFAIPVKSDAENGQEVVNAGDLGYWPLGSAFCIFFGPTPVSREGEIRAASPVNIFGKLIGEAKTLKLIEQGEKITIEKLEP
jgi:hypothetical protein